MASNIVGIGPAWLGRRQTGLKNPLGTKSHIYEQIYSNILPYGSWDHTFNNIYTSVHGGVFCLEFSPEGSLLVAACEKRSVLVFDPLTHKRIQSLENAHLDCVNCVRFLDSRSFATCSDDLTVALWDVRNMSQKVRSLKGHSNWVKNIEYSPKDGLLVTSGFDGRILTWEMNTYKEDGVVYNKVFATNGLMRTQLSPDASKMIICTTGGYLIVIHNLDLKTMSQDLDGFKPNMYRLMQLSQTILPVASDFTHLFRGQGKRNRVEFITDFPEGDDAEVVSSLQIHPDGHSAISRNVSNNEKSEWSCIHNIEERLSSDESDFTDDDADENEGCKLMSWPETSASISTTPSYVIQHIQNERSMPSRTDSETNHQQHDLSVSPSDIWEALVAIQEARIRRETDNLTSEMSVGHMFRRQTSDTIQSRPTYFDNQIFVARILPNVNANNDNSELLGRVTSESTVFRRTLSVNSPAEILPRNVEHQYSTSVSLSSSPRGRRKIPVCQRYTSLYRRSLVGQYDRTSVLRKPIYKRRIIELTLRKLKKRFHLNTNYEINESRRLRNELFSDSTSCNAIAKNVAFSINASSSDLRVGKDEKVKQLATVQNKGKKIKVRENENLKMKKRSTSSLSGESNGGIPSSSNVLNEGITIAKKNSNSVDSMNEVAVTTFDDSLRQSESTPVTAYGNEEKSDCVAGCNEAPTSSNTVLSAGASATVELEEVVPTETRDSVGEARQSESSKPNPREPPVRNCLTSEAETSSASSSAGERTILMGVFRAGSEGGVRGTTMRKHNVATVTVSSPGETEVLSPERRKYKCIISKKTQINMSANDNCVGVGSARNRGDCGNTSKSDNNGNGGAGKRSGKSNGHSSSQPFSALPLNKKIHQNAKRLTHYVEEPNLGRGFIKELCVSPDGRIICSPFGNGIRLLSFSPGVQDILHCYPLAPPVPLHELTLNVAHTDIVVSTKFSPFHNLLVSGCLSGKIVYYQPFL